MKKKVHLNTVCGIFSPHLKKARALIYLLQESRVKCLRDLQSQAGVSHFRKIARARSPLDTTRSAYMAKIKFIATLASIDVYNS